MPVTDEDLDGMIIRIDSDENYLYDVSLETIIALAEECEFDVNKMCDRYTLVFVKNLKTNNKSITEAQAELITPQIMQRIGDFFYGVISYYDTDKPNLAEVVEQINQPGEDGEPNLVVRLGLTATAIKESLNVVLFNLTATELQAKQAGNIVQLLTPPRAQHGIQDKKNISHFSSPRPSQGTKTYTLLEKVKGDLLEGVKAISWTPHKANIRASAVSDQEHSKTFTPSFSGSKDQHSQGLSQNTIDFLKLNEFSVKNSELDKCTSKNKQFARHTPLTLATLQINEAVCSSLLNDGADVNAENGVGNTPLHMLCHAVSTKGAAIDSILRLADMFLSNGGDLARKSKDHKTPIDIATNPLLAAKFKQFSSQAKLELVL